MVPGKRRPKDGNVLNSDGLLAYLLAARDPHAAASFAAVFLLGAVAGTFGSMVGLGGGFIVVPILRLVFGLSPAAAAGTSLALVVAGTGSGAATYLMQRRVHLRVGIFVALGGLPGSIAGTIIVHRLPGTAFDSIFALFLLAVAADILINRRKRLRGREEAAAGGTSTVRGMSAGRSLAAGLAIGFISSLLGVGGGFVLVPALLYLSDLPAHAIAATSQFAILLTSPVGLAAHALAHDVRLAYAVPLVLGGLAGGAAGPHLARRMAAERLIVYVAGAMILAAVLLLVRDIVGYR